MWVSHSLLDLFQIGRSTVDQLREDNSTLRTANGLLERELAGSKIMSDWLRMKVNQLEVERVYLLRKAYPGLDLPAPEIARTANRVKDAFDLQAIFEDQGDSITDAPSLPFASN